LINRIKLARDPTDSAIQICRIGLTNNNSTANLISTIGNYFVTASLANNKKKRSTSVLTCTILNSLSGALNSLSATQLLTLTSQEFISCQILLGSSSNSWSSNQLNALATVAKTAYPVVSSISDTNLSQLKSILVGFSYSDLSSLVFTTTTSINSLGSLNGWNSSQLNALSTPLTNYITNYIGNTITVNFLTSAANLACSLTSNQINSISNSTFISSISVLSKISLTCPNISLFYALAKKAYGNSLINSSSSITEIGSLIGNYIYIFNSAIS
jgi:hypothetical protein